MLAGEPPLRNSAPEMQGTLPSGAGGLSQLMWGGGGGGVGRAPCGCSTCSRSRRGPYWRRTWWPATAPPPPPSPRQCSTAWSAAGRCAHRGRGAAASSKGIQDRPPRAFCCLCPGLRLPLLLGRAPGAAAPCFRLTRLDTTVAISTMLWCRDVAQGLPRFCSMGPQRKQGVRGALGAQRLAAVRVGHRRMVREAAAEGGAFASLRAGRQPAHLVPVLHQRQGRLPSHLRRCCLPIPCPGVYCSTHLLIGPGCLPPSLSLLRWYATPPQASVLSGSGMRLCSGLAQTGHRCVASAPAVGSSDAEMVRHNVTSNMVSELGPTDPL